MTAWVWSAVGKIRGWRQPPKDRGLPVLGSNTAQYRLFLLAFERLTFGLAGWEACVHLVLTKGAVFMGSR